MAEITYKQGTNFYDPNTGKAVGTVQYDPNTGQKLSSGQSVTQTINSASLKPTTPSILPPAPTGNPAQDALLNNVGNITANATLNQATNAGNAQSKYASLIDMLGTKGSATEQASKEAQLEEKGKLAKSLEAQILKADQEHKKQIDALYGQGGTTREQAAPLINEANRLYASQAADRAIEYHILNGDYMAARGAAEKKIEAEFEGYKDQLNALNMFITQNKQLSDADQIALQHKYRMIENNVNTMESYKKSAFDYLLQNGGTPTQTSAWANAKTPQELVDIFGTGFIAGATPSLPSGQPDVVGALRSTIDLSGKDVPQASTSLSVLTNLQKMALNNPEGKFIGAAGGSMQGTFNLRSGTARQEFANTRSDISALKGTVSKWLSGLTLSKQQEKDILKLVPQETDNDFTFRTKINNLTDFFQRQAQAELASKGISYTPIPVDYFATPVDNYVNSALEKVTDPYQMYLQSIYGQQ